MAGEAFARDLGYLDQFFQKLEAHAGTLDPAAAARLKMLIGEERTRWAEIKALVTGEKPAVAAGKPAVAAASPPAAAPKREDPRPKPAFTVGSLIGQR